MLKSISSFLIVTIAAVLILAELGIDIAPLLASAGIAGVALAFGAQNLVKDFLAGIFMTLEDQYGVGDTVDLGPASGTVVAVGLRTTTLRAGDGTIWHVRNGEVLRVGNSSQGEAVVTIELPLPYDADAAARRRRSRCAEATASPRSPQFADVGHRATRSCSGSSPSRPASSPSGCPPPCARATRTHSRGPSAARSRSRSTSALRQNPARGLPAARSIPAPPGDPGRPLHADGRARVRDNGPVTAPATFYDEIGGHPRFRRIVDRFYAIVADDPVLRPLYPEADLGPAEVRLRMFLEQYWGGPRTYSDLRGHPRLRMRHAPFVIGPRERDAWLAAMRTAVDGAGLDEQHRERLWAYLGWPPTAWSTR